ncbi:MAG: hypothetical protein OEQ39_00510 [Gammaproteobacteria bacterium]|nr:hypothetical protein [Gammaproteobacteria bacterium]
MALPTILLTVAVRLISGLPIHGCCAGITDAIDFYSNRFVVQADDYDEPPVAGASISRGSHYRDSSRTDRASRDRAIPDISRIRPMAQE